MSISSDDNNQPLLKDEEVRHQDPPPPYTQFDQSMNMSEIEEDTTVVRKNKFSQKYIIAGVIVLWMCLPFGVIGILYARHRINRLETGDDTEADATETTLTFVLRIMFMVLTIIGLNTLFYFYLSYD